MSVIAINNNKGGVLKTSINTNLAGVLVAQGKKVLLIDTDNQGNVCLSFGINPDTIPATLFNVLVEGVDVKKAIIRGYESEQGVIDILPSNDELSFFDLDVIGDSDIYPTPFYLLREHCNNLKEMYDYILIDTPPSIGLMVGNVLSYADSVLRPFQPEQYSMRSLIKVIGAVKQFKDKHNPNLKILGVLGTLIDSRTVLHSEVLQQTRRYCFEQDIRCFETVITRSIRFANAIAYNSLPATLTSDKNNQMVQAYFELWKEITVNE